MYYKHSKMSDGHLNTCKTCKKEYATKHRNDNIERIREYDRKRGSRQDATWCPEYRRRFPKKYRAHNMVNNYKRDGKIEEGPCEVCGHTEKVTAHHDDYDKPLEIRWLCYPHHAEWHKLNGEAKNAV